MTSERKFNFVFYPLAGLLIVGGAIVTIIKSFHIEINEIGVGLMLLAMNLYETEPTVLLSWLFYSSLVICTMPWLNARRKRLDARVFNGWNLILAVGFYAAVGIMFQPVMMTAMMNPLFAAGITIYAHKWISPSVVALAITVPLIRALRSFINKTRTRHDPFADQVRAEFDPEQFRDITSHPALLEAWNKENH